MFDSNTEDQRNVDLRFMQQALVLAAKGQGFTSPNPAVGAIIVQNRQIVGQGYHRRVGEAHAEVEALRSAGKHAKGSTMYVTLEPCNHYGRTPPCTEAIIKAGIQRVVFAVRDPNPKVLGRGGQRLLQAGIEITEDVCSEEAWRLNRFFFHYTANTRPYILAKFSISLDGKIATRTGDSRWISGEEARQQGHFLRQICDAILIGAGTALADNPFLTTRLKGIPEPRHPLRILLDSRGRVPLNASLFQPTLPGRTIVAATNAMPEAHRVELCRRQIEVLILPAAYDGRVNLFSLIETLRKREITSILVEGGGEVLSSFFSYGLVNEVWAFIAPIIIGGDCAPGPVRGTGVKKILHAFSLQKTSVEKIGCDYLFKGYA